MQKWLIHSLVKKKIALLALSLLIIGSNSAHARIIFVDDVFENDSETYEIGADDDASATTLTLEFGGTNAESLSWDTSQFNLSDDLSVTGNVSATDVTANGILDANGIATIGDGGDTVAIDSSSWDISAAGVASGLTGITSSGNVDFSSATNITIPHTNSTSFTIDNDESGNPDQDVELIAEQGSENNGILRYDDGNNRWEFSNDGTTFNPIAADVDLATAQLRRSTSFTASNGSYADVDFDTVDVENNTSVIDADTTSDDFTAGEDGYYLISYHITQSNSAIAAIDARARTNGTTVINGSERSTGTHTAIPTGNVVSATFVVNLSSSDTVELQIQGSTGTITVAADVTFVITKLDGIKGDQGLPGSAGVGTDSTTFTLDQDNAGAGANIDIIANQGTDSDGTLRYNATSNVWELSNNGGGFNQIATFADTDFEGIYTNDGDNTLTTSNGAFTINTGTNDFIVTSNDWSVDASGNVGTNAITASGLVDVGVAGENIEIGDGTAADHFINFDDGTNRNFGWDDSETNFSTFGQEFESLCGHSMVFWAEEAGTLSTTTSGGLQFSWGNGNVAAHGAVQACPGQVVAMTMNCDVNTTSGDSVQVALNGVAQGAGCQVDSQGSANFKTSDTTCSVAFSANDAIAPITTADAGNGNGCTVAMYVRYD